MTISPVTSAVSQPRTPNSARNDPELGMYDIRIFWLAALVAMLAVLMVAYFKTGY